MEKDEQVMSVGELLEPSRLFHLARAGELYKRSAELRLRAAEHESEAAMMAAIGRADPSRAQAMLESLLAAKRQKRERRCVAVTSSDDRGNCACGCRDERICKSCRDGSFTFTATLYEAGSDAHKTRACGTCFHWHTDQPSPSTTKAYCPVQGGFVHISDWCSQWQEGATEVER